MSTAIDKTKQDSLTHESVLSLLKEGNKRFVDNNRNTPQYLDQVSETTSGQFPMAAVLGCIDSRVPSEIVFDLGIGDIFNARVAGNTANEDILGSLEYACKVAGSKLIVVLGHVACGAVKSACDHVELGNITALLSKIQPAVSAESGNFDQTDSSNPAFVQAVADTNVNMTIENIKKNSPILNEMVENGEIDIVGAMYDVGSGKVTFFN